jgi:hypothetical protein
MTGPSLACGSGGVKESVGVEERFVVSEDLSTSCGDLRLDRDLVVLPKTTLPAFEHYARATPQISSMISSLCMRDWGTSVMGGKTPGTQSATAARNSSVSVTWPSDVK